MSSPRNQSPQSALTTMIVNYMEAILKADEINRILSIIQKPQEQNFFMKFINTSQATDGSFSGRFLFNLKVNDTSISQEKFDQELKDNPLMHAFLKAAKNMVTNIKPDLTLENIQKIKDIVAGFFEPIESTQKWQTFWEKTTKTMSLEQKAQLKKSLIGIFAYKIMLAATQSIQQEVIINSRFCTKVMNSPFDAERTLEDMRTEYIENVILGPLQSSFDPIKRYLDKNDTAGLNTSIKLLTSSLQKMTASPEFTMLGKVGKQALIKRLGEMLTELNSLPVNDHNRELKKAAYEKLAELVPKRPEQPVLRRTVSASTVREKTPLQRVPSAPQLTTPEKKPAESSATSTDNKPTAKNKRRLSFGRKTGQKIATAMNAVGSPTPSPRGSQPNQSSPTTPRRSVMGISFSKKSPATTPTTTPATTPRGGSNISSPRAQAAAAAASGSELTVPDTTTQPSMTRSRSFLSLGNRLKRSTDSSSGSGIKVNPEKPTDNKPKGPK